MSSSLVGNRTPAGVTRTLGLALRALRHRNFRLFTVGQTISVVGTWMQQVAMGWLVYRLTDSAFLLGLVGFTSQAPGFFLAPLGGALADRHNKRHIVITVQAAAMAQALVLAILVLAGRITVWEILVLSAWLGAVSGFDIPARQAFLLEMVDDRADLPNAIALNSSMFNAARLVGPAIAGFVIALAGEGICFLANGISYLAVLASLFAMRLSPRPPPPPAPPVLNHIREGFRYAFRFRPIRSVLLLVATVSVLGVPFTVLLPIFATRVLGGGPHVLGLLMAASGLGALAGALFLASRSTVRGLGRIIAVSAAVFGGSLVLFGLSRWLWLSLPLLVVAGFGMMTQMASSNTVLQTIVADDKRGRIMALYTMAFAGMTPLGSLMQGSLAAVIGAPATLALGGAASAVAALAFATRLPALRRLIVPIYARLGIIPEVASGIQAATHSTTPRRRPG